MRHDWLETACCACTLTLSLVWPARTRSMRATSTPATTSTPERSIMLPSSLHAPIHRYFERLGEFLTENRDVLGESARVKPFDVSFVHQSCDTLVVSTSLLSAHDRLPASSSSPIKTPTLPLPPSTTLQLAGAPPHCADADATALGTSGLRQPHLDSQSPSSPSRPILSTISSIPPATTHAFSEFDKYKRLSWLDVLSLTIDEPTVGNPASWRSLFRSLSPDTQQQQATIDPADASSASFASCSSTSLEPEASHIEQGRIATTTGRALCGALVDVMLAIIRHRQRQGWSTAILIMSDDARRAVVLGLNHIGERVRANEPYVCERRLRATDRTYLPPSFSHSLPPDPAEPVGGAAIRIAYVFNRTLRDISSDCHRFNECHSAKHAPCSIAPNRCCSIRSIISTRRHRGVQPRLHCRLATVSKTRRQQLLWRAPVERNQAHSINQVQQQPLQEDSRERQTR